MAFLGIGKKKRNELPPLSMPPPPPDFSKQAVPSDQYLFDMPKFEDFPPLPPLPDLPESQNESKVPKMKEDKPMFQPSKPLGLQLPPLPKLPPLPEFNEDELFKETVDIPLPPLPKESWRVDSKKSFEPLPALDKRNMKYPGLKPLFVKSNDYNAIVAGINTINNRMKEAESMLEDIESLRKEKEKYLQEWRSLLEDTQRKLVYVDKMLFEA